LNTEETAPEAKGAFMASVSSEVKENPSQ